MVRVHAGQLLFSEPSPNLAPVLGLYPRVSPLVGEPTTSSAPNRPRSPRPAATHASWPPLATAIANATPDAPRSRPGTCMTTTYAYRPNHDAPIPSPSARPRRASPVAAGKPAATLFPPSRKRPTKAEHRAPAAPSIAKTLSSRVPTLVPSSQPETTAPRTAWPAAPPVDFLLIPTDIGRTKRFPHEQEVTT